MKMEWLWIILGTIILIAAVLVMIIMASKKLHPTTPDEDDDQMEAIRQCNEKRVLRDAKRKTRENE